LTLAERCPPLPPPLLLLLLPEPAGLAGAGAGAALGAGAGAGVASVAVAATDVCVPSALLARLAVALPLAAAVGFLGAPRSKQHVNSAVPVHDWLPSAAAVLRVFVDEAIFDESHRADCSERLLLSPQQGTHTPNKFKKQRAYPTARP
jgi:hypothetical protein